MITSPTMVCFLMRQVQRICLSIWILSHLAVTACAQKRPPPPPSSTPGRTHVVAVGRRGDDLALRFSPEETVADVGDLIQFQFYPVNHSVVAADFSGPCVPLDLTGGRAFFSGFQPLSPDTDTLTFFTINVSTPNPMFFYCSQGQHCQQGFVGVVNPTAEQSLERFRAAAALAPENLSPGEIPRQLPITAPLPSSSSDSSDDDDYSLGYSNGTDSTSRANQSNPVRNIGAIVGGALGGVLFLGLLIGSILFCRKKRKRLAELGTITSRRKGFENETKEAGIKVKSTRSSRVRADGNYARKKPEISRPSLVAPAYLLRDDGRSPITGLIPIASPPSRLPSSHIYAPVAIRSGKFRLPERNLPLSGSRGEVQNYENGGPSNLSLSQGYRYSGAQEISPPNPNERSQPRVAQAAFRRTSTGISDSSSQQYQENPYSTTPTTRAGLTRGYTVIATGNPYIASNGSPTYDPRRAERPSPTTSVYTSDAYMTFQFPLPSPAASGYNGVDTRPNGAMIRPI